MNYRKKKNKPTKKLFLQQCSWTDSRLTPRITPLHVVQSPAALATCALTTELNSQWCSSQPHGVRGNYVITVPCTPTTDSEVGSGVQGLYPFPQF